MSITLEGHIRLPGRGVLRVGGTEAEDFLQSLVSNDVSKSGPDRTVYATLLTPQGKFLHDFFVWRDAEGFLLEMEGERLPDLKKRLTMYKLRSKVDLSDESEAWTSLVLLGGELPDVGFAARDPRHDDMGTRLLIDASEQIDGTEGAFSEWDRCRISLGIPDGSRDIEIEKSFLLEHRMDELNAIDFKKGCYVGQELTARTKYRGNVRKKLTHVTVDGTLPEHGTPILAEGIQVGTVLTGYGQQALAMLRIERPDGALEAGDATLSVG